MSKPIPAQIRIFDPSFSLGQLTELTGFHLRRASILDFGSFSDTSGDPAITPLRYSVLEVIGSNEGIRQIELARVLGLSKPSATIVIDFWQARDCVIRKRSSEDARARSAFDSSW